MNFALSVVRTMSGIATKLATSPVPATMPSGPGRPPRRLGRTFLAACANFLNHSANFLDGSGNFSNRSKNLFSGLKSCRNGLKSSKTIKKR
jgi:hypothetical protein